MVLVVGRGGEGRGGVYVCERERFAVVVVAVGRWWGVYVCAWVGGVWVGGGKGQGPGKGSGGRVYGGMVRVWGGVVCGGWEVSVAAVVLAVACGWGCGFWWCGLCV